jgi:energy-coupling factor transporter ATP-binding protein EcfA2
MRAIIAVSGKTTSGKSTLLSCLAQAVEQVRVCGFADELKHDLVELTGYSLDDSTKAAYRGLMQEYGRTMRLLGGADYWSKRMRSANSVGVIIAVGDVRYPAEVEFLREWAADEGAHFLSVRLEVSPAEQARRYLLRYGAPPTDKQLSDDSETALDTWGMWDVHFRPDEDLLYMRDRLLTWLYSVGALDQGCAA